MLSEVPQDHAIGSSKQQMLPVEILQRAGDWIQWGLDGAVKGVERTCDGETWRRHVAETDMSLQESMAFGITEGSVRSGGTL